MKQLGLQFKLQRWSKEGEQYITIYNTTILSFFFLNSSWMNISLVHLLRSFLGVIQVFSRIKSLFYTLLQALLTIYLGKLKKLIRKTFLTCSIWKGNGYSIELFPWAELNKAFFFRVASSSLGSSWHDNGVSELPARAEKS
jgi:hypothetical protein